MLQRLIGLSAVVLLAAVPASAATITFGGSSVNDNGQFSTVAGATTIDFNARPLGPQDFVAGIASYDDVQISICPGCTGTGDVRDDTTNFATAQTRGGSYAINFSQPLSYFGLYWGSPDVGNEVRLFNGALLVHTVTGLQVGGVGGFGVDGAAYVNVFAGAGEQFTRVVVVGGQFPLESDNHAFVAVPEPASILLFGTGVSGLMLRRRRQQR